MKELEYKKESQFEVFSQKVEIFNKTLNQEFELEQQLNIMDIKPFLNLERTSLLDHEKKKATDLNINIIKHDFQITEDVSQNKFDTNNLLLNIQQTSLDFDFVICKFKIKPQFFQEVIEKDLMIDALDITYLNQTDLQSLKFIIKNLTKNLDLKNEILIENSQSSESRIYIYKSVFNDIESCLKIALNVQDKKKKEYIIKKLDRYLHTFHDELNIALIKPSGFGYLVDNYYNFTAGYQKLDFIFINYQAAKILDCFTYWF